MPRLFARTEPSTDLSSPICSAGWGTLRSLHHFLHEKRRNFGVRFYSDRPSLLRTRATLSDGSSVDYALLSLPLYLAGEVRRRCAALREQGPLDASCAGSERPAREQES
ncbi:MAG: hypothetical protein IPN34_10640 [Planctomycetes bacterium]|nr:hypothetical protein [Planctomycetota bacterium]